MNTLFGQKTQSQTFLAKVFGYMFLALGISALTSILFASNPELMASLITKTADNKQHLTGLGWLTLLAPLGFVLVMSFGYQSLSAITLKVLFILYSAITGASMSFILLAYTTGSVVGCFLSAAAMFGIMAAFGYFTKKDLSSWGNILFMALIGIIVASLINLFLHNSMMDMLISIIGVIVFCALTAYDVQKIKSMEYEYNDKGAIMGALSLYLDFLNLFLYLLRLFGNGSKD